MTSSIIFLKNMIYRLRSYSADHDLCKYTKLILPAILLIGIAISTDGCAANKCDCPRFSGHRLGH